MKRILVGIILALVLAVVPTLPAFAADFDEIAVTATPAYMAITITPDTYTIGGAGVTIEPATTYYANPGAETMPPTNPVDASECAFTITNTSTIITDITVNFPNFASGDAMVNSNGGYLVAGAGQFGVSGYITAAAWPTGVVILQSAASAPLKENLAATTDIKFGWVLLTQSDIWTSPTAMTSTVVVTATPS